MKKQLQNFFETIQACKVIDLERNLSNIDGYILELEKEKASYKSDYKANLDYYNNQIKTHNLNKKILNDKSIPLAKKELEEGKTFSEKKAKEELRRLLKHKGVQDIKVVDRTIIITTPLVFVPIRKKAGSKEHERTCIGAFEFILNFATNSLEVKNLIFKRHWAINDSNIPCLGEFATEIKRLMEKAAICDVWDLMWLWLIGADLDSAAYMRSHNWKMGYRPIEVTPIILPIGSLVVLKDHLPDLPSSKGLPAMIVNNTRRSLYSIAFKDHRVTSGTIWSIHIGYAHLISQRMFNKSDKFKVTIIGGDLLNKIDKLPAGTLEDYQKFIEKNKTSRIKVTPISDTSPLAVNSTDGSIGGPFTATHINNDLSI